MVITDYLYYKVDDFVTTNKLTAVEKAGNDLGKIHFYFADDEHAKHDWTVEPEEDINDLIDQRVREIRDQYPYVALWYSGGYDSQSILDSFIRQNIRLDEIVIYSRPWLDHQYNIEHEYAYRFADYVKKTHWPGLKINVIFYNHQSLFDFYQYYGTDWIYHDYGSLACFNKYHRASTAYFQKEFRDIANTIGRVDINGVDKPRVNLYQGKWYSQMPDRALYFVFNSPYELFYISPSATKLYIKQTWMAIRWFESLQNCSHELVHQVQSHQCSGEVYAQWNLGVGRSNVHDFIAKTGIFKAMFMGVGTNPLETRDMVAALQIQNPEVYKIWKTGVDKMATSQAKNWEGDIGLKTVLSNPIFVKDFTQPKGVEK